MKRRQFGALLATATFSLGGVASASADATAQETDPLEIEDASVSLGGVASSVGRATFAYEDGTMEFAVSDWSMEGRGRSLSISGASVTAEDVSAETYATVRSAMVDSFEGRSVSPLLTALAEVEVDADSAVGVSAESVELDGQLVADRITASGTVGSVVPEGTRALVQDGATLEEGLALGASEWSSLTLQRGDSEVTLDDVVIERDGAALLVTSPSGSAAVSDRAFEYSEMSMTVVPPETIPAAHVEFASQVRGLAAEGDLTAEAVRSAASDAGVTVSNTVEAVRNARFELSFGEVTEDGEALVSDFQTSGTLAELVQVVRQQV